MTLLKTKRFMILLGVVIFAPLILLDIWTDWINSDIFWKSIYTYIVIMLEIAVVEYANTKQKTDEELKKENYINR